MQSLHLVQEGQECGPFLLKLAIFGLTLGLLVMGNSSKHSKGVFFPLALLSSPHQSVATLSFSGFFFLALGHVMTLWQPVFCYIIDRWRQRIRSRLIPSTAPGGIVRVRAFTSTIPCAHCWGRAGVVLFFINPCYH